MIIFFKGKFINIVLFNIKGLVGVRCLGFLYILCVFWGVCVIELVFRRFLLVVAFGGGYFIVRFLRFLFRIWSKLEIFSFSFCFVFL